MHDSPQLDPTIMETISPEFLKACDLLKYASWQMVEREISSHPLFLMSRQTLPFGDPIFPPEDQAGPGDWKFFASYLEDMVERKIISRKHEFQEAYKDVSRYCCLFVIDGDFNNFVFIPYP